MDFYLDPTTHDLVLENTHPKQVSGYDEIRQRVKVTLLAHRGEWLEDTDFGVPYREEILVHNPNLDAIAARIRSVVLGVEGIIRVNTIEASLDLITRKLTVAIDADPIESVTIEI